MNYKGIEITCTQEELDLFISTIPVKQKVYNFTEKYNNVVIGNPTGVSNAKYYTLSINGSTFLQAHSPYEQGFVAITEDNAQSIIDNQKEQIIDSLIFEKFKITKEKETEILQERLQALEQSNAEMMNLITMMSAPAM